MQQIKDISIKDFSYDLPEERIAKYPLEKRDASKLLIYKNGSVSDHHFYNLPEHLKEKDLLIFNNTKVIRARIHFQKSTGSTIEVFCLDPADHFDPALVFQQKHSCRWNALVGNAKRWKNETLQLELSIHDEVVTLSAKIENRLPEHFIIQFDWTGDHTFADILEAAGKLPIPPYLNRETEDDDLIRYQTVYAKYDGSVAAPTAGLHFTSEVFSELEKKEIATAEVTLHVGAGTFRPVKSETMADHEMHEERMYIHRETIEKLLAHHSGGRVIVVGTTSMRTIESLYWFGVLLLENPKAEFIISQWTPYESREKVSGEASLNAVLNYMKQHAMQSISGFTSLLIAPGYEFHLINGLITNFHQPNSTLLLLVSAFIGEDWKKVYAHALEKDYRFLSYGDSSLLWRK